MATQTQTEQEWLDHLVGNWDCVGSSALDPDKEPEVNRGHETFRRLGDHWVISEGESTSLSGEVSSGMFTIGFDTEKQTFVGAFICTELSNLWVFSSGTLSEDGSSLTLETEAPDFMAKDGSTTKFREVFSFDSPDHRTLTAFMLRSDGEWERIARSEYFRR
jgi:hypothetical protein